MTAFSAVTVFDGARRTTVHNDSHSDGRQASNLTHELGHALLRHPPSAALDHRGCRLWDQDIEDEAQWLAGVLLLTEDAAMSIVRNRLSVPDAAARYGISPQMVTLPADTCPVRAYRAWCSAGSTATAASAAASLPQGVAIVVKRHMGRLGHPMSDSPATPCAVVTPPPRPWTGTAELETETAV